MSKSWLLKANAERSGHGNSHDGVPRGVRTERNSGVSTGYGGGRVDGVKVGRWRRKDELARRRLRRLLRRLNRARRRAG